MTSNVRVAGVGGGGGPVAFDDATSAEEILGDGVLSLSHTSTGSDRGVFAGVAWDDDGGSAGSASVTYGGSGMTEMWDFDHATQTTKGNAGYRLHNQATGAQNVISTLSGSVPQRHFLQVISMTGVNQTSPVGTPATAQGPGTVPSVTATGAGANDMVVDNLFCNSGSPPTPGANQTQDAASAQDDTSDYSAASYQDGADGGVMTWAPDSNDWWSLGAVAFLSA